jgi:hypothetical protein
MAPFSPGEIAAILAAHNKYRTAVGIDPLRWSDDLAKSAQKHADTLVSTSPWTRVPLPHSYTPNPRRPGENLGENIAAGTTGSYTVTDFVDNWGKEKENFVYGTFPHVARPGIDPVTGQPYQVYHYTQMVWRDTTEVGCGLVTTTGLDPSSGNRPWNILVAQYHKAGNWHGERVY